MRVAFALCGFFGGVALPTLSILAEHGGLKHYRMSNVFLLFGPSGLLSQRCSLALACDPCVASLGAEVMIGNSVSVPAATHNQTLPTVTMMSLLAMLPHW